MDEVTGQRVPGVRYRKVKRFREKTITIGGTSSTRTVPYDAWEPLRPRDWDAVVLRGVMTLAVVVTVVAVVGTTASVGGLLSTMVTESVAYGMGAVFTASWVGCLGLEWLSRLNPAAGRAARIAGRVALAVSMSAVVAYGYTLGVVVAGVVGAAIDGLAKGLWSLVIKHHAVPLDEDVAHWLDMREQRIAATELVAVRSARMNGRAAYQHAIHGQEISTAAAILALADTTGPCPDNVPVVSAATTAPVSVPARPVQAPPVPPTPRPSMPVPVAPAPATVPAPGQSTDTTAAGHGADMSGQPVRTVSAQLSAPPVAPAPPVSGQLPDTPDIPETAVPNVSGGDVEGTAPRKISAPTIVGTINAALETDAGMSDEALTAHVALVFGDRKNLADTVRRTRAREERKKKAS